MLNRFHILYACAAAVLAASAAEVPFALPASVAETKADASGRTWRMTGTATNALAAVRADFTAALTNAGWRSRHVIPLDRTGFGELQAWMRGRDSLILMLRRAGETRTFFAWGTEKEEMRR